MAEALAIIGLASAIVQFVDFSTKVVGRLRTFQKDAVNGPKVFQDIGNRLPLIVELVQRIRDQSIAGEVSSDSQNIMLPVIQSCLAQVELLDDLLTKVLPKLHDSSWMRGRKALSSVVRESEIEKIDSTLKSNFDLLIQAGTFQSISRLELRDPQPPHQIRNMAMPPSYSVATLPQHRTERSESLSLQPVFMVPFQRDPRFLGRQSELQEIDLRFASQRQVAIAGLGGIGKSQIAIEYCYSFKDLHPYAHVFWIYAGSAARFEQGYQTIARRLALPGWEDPKVNTLQLIYEYLSDEHNGRWLMIIDNADDTATFFTDKSGTSAQGQETSKPLARYLPQSPNGSILITTRDKRVGERLAGRMKPVEILPMTALNAKELLRSRMSENDWNDADATKLIEELANLPLAITQAAAFISENDLTISEYLELLATGDADLKDLLSVDLEDPRRDLDTENSVMRTWKLSFDQISKGKPRAAQILSLMAVLDYHGAPRTLLRKDEDTEIEFRTALGALQAFSLITAEKGKDAACKMHPLVALSTQKWLEVQGMLLHWQVEALKVLSEHFPERPSYEYWSLLEALTPHALLVFSFTYSTTMDQLQCAKLLDYAALYDLGKGKYTEAFEKSDKSLLIRENLLPKEDPRTLESVQILGETLLHLGELDSAKTMLQRAISGREKTIGVEHPDTLESYSDLTITLLELDDLTAAEEIGEKALKGREKILGHDDPDTLVSLNILAMLRQRQGNLTAAREMCARALKGREQVLGREHPDTLMTLNNMAMLHYRQGELSTAREMFETVLAGEERLLGPECYDIQVSLTNMALVLEGQGDFDAAESMHRRVLKARERLLGPDHRATLFTIKNLAAVCEQKGDVKAAEKMHQRVRRVEEQNSALGTAGALMMAGLLFD